MEVIKKIKVSGNDYFSQKNYVDAGRKYKKALRYYKWMIKTADTVDPCSELIVNIRMALLLNLAAVKLKAKKHREVLKLCTEVSLYCMYYISYFNSFLIPILYLGFAVG